MFILRLIEVAMKQGYDFAENNKELNEIIDSGLSVEGDFEEQKQRTAQSMTDAMECSSSELSEERGTWFI